MIINSATIHMPFTPKLENIDKTNFNPHKILKPIKFVFKNFVIPNILILDDNKNKISINQLKIYEMKGVILGDYNEKTAETIYYTLI